MAAFGNLQVIDRGGWRKEFALSKSLIYVGSDPGNDIVLDPQHGTGVAARHLQVLYLAAPGSAGRVRIINLGRADIPLDPRSPAVQTPVLRPWSAVVVGDGTRFQLGDFTLIFQLNGVVVEASPLPAVVEHRPTETATPTGDADAARPEATLVAAADIGLRLHLEGALLRVGEPLAGRIVVRNQGNEPAVQIRLALEGLDPDCYEMGPGPILFPNAEKEVFLRLHHSRKPSPAAGVQRISISATAPVAYPGQRAEASSELQIAPFYAQELRFLDAAPAAKQTLAVEIYNAGNTRSRFDLSAEDDEGALAYAWLLQGEPAVDAGVALAPDDEEPATGAGASDRLAAAAAKAQSAGKATSALAGVLGTLSTMIPAPAGPWLLRLSNSMRRNQIRVQSVVNAPSRTARSLRSLLPRQLQPSQRGQARPVLQVARSSTRQASCRTPFVEPGERLVAELRFKRLGRHGGRHTIRVASQVLVPEGAESVPSAVAAQTVQVEGVSWVNLLLLAVIALLILAIALGLAYGLKR